MKTFNKLASIVLMSMPFAVVAQQYPDRPINLIVPYAAGGGTDTAARMLGKRLSELLGQQVIVENKAGAATQIGTNYVVRAKPDGYTLLMGTANLATNPAFYSNLPYNAAKDLVPVAQVTDVPVYLFASAEGPLKSFDDILNQAKGSTLSYASAGVGSIPHLAGEIFARNAKINLQNVPYKGSSEAVVAVASNQVPFSFDNLAPAYAQVKAGRLVPYAIATKDRSPTLPDVPTLSELGYPVIAASWWGVLAPTGTPASIVETLNQKINAVLDEPEVQEFFLKQGMHAVGGSSKAFADHIATETSKWQEIVTEAKITLGN